MTVDDLTIAQIREALVKIEAPYRNYKGEVDLLKFSKEQPPLFATWRALRNRVRTYDKELKTDENRRKGA